MPVDRLSFLSPKEFSQSAKDDPDVWERLRGRKIIHPSLGCGLITKIIKVSSSTRKWCDAIFVTFNNNEFRFTPLDFINGEFTDFFTEHRIVIEQILDYLNDLNIEKASQLYEKHENRLIEDRFDYISKKIPYLELRKLLEKFHFIEADAFVLKCNLLSKDNYERVRSRFVK